jgi:hypothetical protein
MAESTSPLNLISEKGRGLYASSSGRSPSSHQHPSFAGKPLGRDCERAWSCLDRVARSVSVSGLRLSRQKRAYPHEADPRFYMDGANPQGPATSAKPRGRIRTRVFGLWARR